MSRKATKSHTKYKAVPGNEMSRKERDRSRGERIAALLPAVLLLSVLPLAVWGQKIETSLSDYAWFSDQDVQYDFFIHIKAVLLIALAVWMLIVLADERLIRQKKAKSGKAFIPLFLYGGLTVLSTILSTNKTLSLKGMWQMDESVWVLLAYLIAAWYAYQIVESVRDIKILLGALAIGAAFQAVIGLSQLAGTDIFSTEAGKTLLTLGLDKTIRENLVFRYAENSRSNVYMALYTPNYAGVYIILGIPVLLALAYVIRKKAIRCVLLLLCALLAACFVGSGSRTGLLVLCLLFLFAAWILPVRTKQKCLVFSLCVLLGAGAIVGYDFGRNHNLSKSISASLKKSTYSLENITPEKDYVLLDYKGRELKLYPENTDLGEMLTVREDGGTESAAVWDSGGSCFRIDDTELKELSFDVSADGDTLYFKMTLDGIEWNFVRTDEEAGFVYINGYGKADKIVTAETVFPGYEKALTGRVYLWGRIIPLLKKYILWGSGPDTFVTQFPQQDYVMRANTGAYMMDNLPTKAHSMYLQTALQTGVLSLICLLAFWGKYLYGAIKRLMKKERDEGWYLCLGVLLGVTGYLLMGFLNDSNPAVSPVFWCLLGTGMAELQQISIF